MNRKVFYSPESRCDMDEIWSYIAFELQNPIAAEHTINRIMETAERLELFAESGAPLSAVSGIETDCRFLVSDNYLIFYRISGSEVYVDRVLYGRRDYLRVLFEDAVSSETEE